MKTRANVRVFFLWNRITIHPFHFEPSFALKAGFTYYVWKFFNFFAEATYYNTTVLNLDRINGRADELMISAGLGFNINTMKKR